MKPKIPNPLTAVLDNPWPKEMTDQEVSRWVRSIHSCPQDFDDGDLQYRINKHDTYRLVNIPLETLNANEWSVSDILVDEYAAQGPDFPPIVLDPKLSIIDGIHRVNASRARGHTMIMAYLASDKS